MTKEEQFARFKEGMETQQRRLEEKAKKANSNFSREYEEIAYTPILEKDWQVIRILDGFDTPYSEIRLPTAPKEILRARIINDEGKSCWINFSPDKKWLLWKIYNKVLAYKWNPNLGPKGGKEYIYDKQFPSLFNQVAYNGATNPNPYEKGWYPVKHVLMNILDRKDKEWHKKNKHSKLLSKKQTVKDGVTYYEPGIPPTVYSSKIFQGVMEDYGILDYFDIGIRKVKTMNPEGKESTEYQVQHSKFLIDKDEIKEYIVNGDLSEEEKAYEKYDLDKLFPVSSYQKIQKNLGLFIQEVDKKLGTNFTKELEDLVAEEKVRFDEIYGNNKKEEEVEVEEITEEVITPITEINEEKVKSRRTVKKEIEVEKDEEKIAELFPIYAKLKDEEKAFVKGLNDKNELEFTSDAGEMVACPEDTCKKPQPEGISSHCIYCGEKFE